MLVNPKTFQTTAFRLAAIYLLLFALSTATVLGYVYYSTISLLERQTEDTIRAEVAGLSDQYRIRGMSGIIDVIQRRSRENGGGFYALNGPSGAHIAGNLVAFPKGQIAGGSWVDIPIEVNDGTLIQKHTVRAFHVELAGEYELLVGRDVQSLHRFGSVIKNTLLWALGLSLILGLGGGFLLSRNFLKRIDAITQASRTIMAGNLSQRMPITGSDDELDQLGTSLNEMLAQIERLMASIKDVTSNVAHDLKTPLTRMKARVEAALRTDAKAEYRAALSQTIEECDSLLSTFNALLSIAQAESGHQRDALETLDVHDILQDVVELYQPIAEDVGGTLTLQTEPGLVVLGNRQLLAQALSNLLDNSLKYGANENQAAAQISVCGKIEKDTVLIEVTDLGSGIPAQDLERVRDRFVRLDKSRSKLGNGLGLSLVASVMTLHGGKLKLENKEPGLKAILSLPLHARI